jgi:TPP-dependent 2-oxoacid decarboxylase
VGFECPFHLVACSWIQAVVNNLDDAHEQIDTAIATALRESKPVYLSISCNLPGLPHPTFSRDPVPFFLTPRYQMSFFSHYSPSGTTCPFFQIHGLFF